MKDVADGIPGYNEGVIEDGNGSGAERMMCAEKGRLETPGYLTEESGYIERF